ncbi:nuclease-related domain-containing protein [Clavibacter sepedonicus]|nr:MULTISPECIES: nuclease-related domain-containing protein [Clavibacter]MBD5381837.1 NERD domain-containing protein [Clavibacter sp.]UUK64272.1 NERD domain-containing protein [Clavibacter sepedonicus]
MLNALPWILVVLLLAALALLCVDRRRRRARHGEALQEQRARHEREVALSDLQHAADAASRAEAHAAELADRAAAREEAEEAAHEARRQLARTWKTDRVSHDLIVAACAAARIGGALATNVVLTGTEPKTKRRFLVQVDHVLLTPRAALIIENKHWRGLVLDAVRPKDLHEFWGALLARYDVDPPAVLHITSDGDDGAFHVRRADPTPVAQVRRQSLRLAAHVQDALGSAPFFHTVVFYSHADAEVIAPEDGEERGATRRILSPAELAPGLRRVMQVSTSPVSRESMVHMTELFASDGAHVEWVGPLA